MKLKPWIEAMRLRTLPVSVAGVLAGCAVATAYGNLTWQPALICLIFALLAQIVSNLANEYYDFKNGIDKKGRQGFRRGVTEGDIKPTSMRNVMFGLMAIDCVIGCSLVYWGGWWLIAVGAVIAVAAFSYSAGPWPLSHHGLGDELVMVFYGIVPVMLTAYVQCGDWTGGILAGTLNEMWIMALIASIGVGLLAINVLTVNNIRDVRDDRAAGKYTKAVILGSTTMRVSYVACAAAGLMLMWFAFHKVLPTWGWAGYAAVAVWYVPVILALFRYDDFRLNKVLKFTSILLMVVTIWTLVCIVLNHDAVSPIHAPNCAAHLTLEFFRNL